MKIAFIGFGKIAFHHFRRLKTLFPESNIDIFLPGTEEIIGLCGGSLNIKPKNLVSFEKYNIGVICSPTYTHFEYINFASNFDYLIIEKPLLDYVSLLKSGLSKENIIEHIHYLNSSSDNVLVNYASKFYIDSIDTSRLKKYSLDFIFHSVGQQENEYLFQDLLPHAVAIFKEYIGKDLIDLNLSGSFVEINRAENQIRASFEFGEFRLNVDFKERSSLDQKQFIIICDQKDSYLRVQKGYGETYKVYLEFMGRGQIEITDPFDSFWRDIYDHVKNKKKKNFEKIDVNMEKFQIQLIEEVLNAL